MKKRVLVISDMHCGSLNGLTPPIYWVNFDDTYKAYQKKLWSIFIKMVNSVKPIDVLIVNGDCIDGKQKKSGGTDLITSDIDHQVKMASIIIEKINAKKVYLTYGSGYHTGNGVDHENQIANNVNAQIDDHGFYDINGNIFDVKHFTSNSSVPHGRFTPIAKEKLWNILWNEYGQTPKSNIIIRSHVHYFGYAGGKDWVAMTTPSLQGLGGKFGSRICSGIVDFGVVVFDVYKKGDFTWDALVVPTKVEKDFITKV